MSSEDAVAFTIKRFVLMGLCEKAMPVISSGDVGVLRCFLVDVAPGRISVTGSDLEMTVVAYSTAVATSDTATLAIPAKRLLAMLKEAPEGDITVETSGAKATVACGLVVSWDLRLGDPADYTRPPVVDEAAMGSASREKFLAGLRTVKHAISRDGSRPPLVMVDITGNTMTASDGSRLQRVMLDFPSDMKIPAAAVDHLVRIMGSSEADQLQASEQGGHLAFRVGAAASATAFITRKTMARFPDMDKLILAPALANEYLLTVDRRGLAEAVRRVRINADAETSAIGLRLTRDKVTVTSRDKDGNGAEQSIPAWWKNDDRLVVVNHVFLTDMLGVWPADNCRFWLGSDSAKKKSMLMLSDKQDGAAPTRIGVINQLHAALLGYG